ncbi:uncharacterized [Tachysurus ichikawai]
MTNTSSPAHFFSSGHSPDRSQERGGAPSADPSRHPYRKVLHLRTWFPPPFHLDMKRSRTARQSISH